MRDFPYTVILTGAGISSESGIATFRSTDGLWEQHRIEDVATPEGFMKNPALVQQFYNQRRAQLMTVTPNAAHQAIARLQRLMGEKVFLVTQNIDDLHERGGSYQVAHMHGELLKARCVRSGRVTDCLTDLLPEPACDCCKPSSMMRPHIVWFGEMPLGMECIYDALAKTELFVSIGTSGNVYPAAGFVAEARRQGAFTLELNLEPSVHNGSFSAGSYGIATKVVPHWVDLMLKSDDWEHDLRRLL
jgi:NAD-dependent protein deacetylases, SIR2 family